MLDLIQWIQEHGTAATAERIAKAESEARQLREHYVFQENQRLCIGYDGGCDGDLEGTEHEEKCPARAKDVELRPHIYAASDPVEIPEGVSCGVLDPKDIVIADLRSQLEQQLQAQRESSISEYNKLAIACNELTLENLRLKQQLAEQQKEIERLSAPVSEIAMASAKEIVGCFNIEVPRGIRYANGILHTIRIIIEQQLLASNAALSKPAEAAR